MPSSGFSMMTLTNTGCLPSSDTFFLYFTPSADGSRIFAQWRVWPAKIFCRAPQLEAMRLTGPNSLYSFLLPSSSGSG